MEGHPGPLRRRRECVIIGYALVCHGIVAVGHWKRRADDFDKQEVDPKLKVNFSVVKLMVMVKLRAKLMVKLMVN
jgi:hypothetical protein